MILTDLPIDLLLALPRYLHNVEDFKNTSSCCRLLRSVFSQTNPHTILALLYASAPTFVQPHPHYLVAATARQLSDWALKDSQNSNELREAFRGGMSGLLDLCLEKGGLSMQEIANLYNSRFSIINPVSDMIDKCAGSQWLSTEDFWEGGVSDPATIDCDADRAAFQIIIYGELFTSTMESFLHPELELPRHSVDIRLDFIRYCIPDWVCSVAYHGMTKPEPVGPYDPANTDQLPGDQIALQHLLNTRRWLEPWQEVRQQIGPDFEESWKQRLWSAAVQTQGLAGLEVITSDLHDTSKARLHGIRDAIQQLELKHKPEVVSFGRNATFEYPDMASDVEVLMNGYWPQPGGPADTDEAT